jgi:DNA-directed RNA polymerase
MSSIVAMLRGVAQETLPAADDVWQARQAELEAMGFEDGRKRFREAHADAMRKGNAGRALAVRKFFVEGVDRLEAAIRFFYDEGMAPGKRGRKHQLIRWIDLLGADTIAYLTMVEMIDGIAQKRVYRQAAELISVRVQDEARYRLLAEEAPGLFAFRMDKLKKTANKRHKKAALDQAVRYADVDDSPLMMTRAERLVIGTHLVEMAIAATGLFYVQTFQRRARDKMRGVVTDKYILATPEAMEWITKRAEMLEILFPVAGPMVVPPKRWGPNGQRGGYLHQLARKYPLVRKVSKYTLKRCEAEAGQLVYDAVNVLQETRWQVNAGVLAVVEEVVRQGGGMAGVPTFREPPRPFDNDAYAALPEEERRAVRQQRAKQMEEYRLFQGAATKVAGITVAAKRVANAPAIFFPYSLDFRGRIYSLSSYLNPQGDDLCRGLLQFAEAKAVGAKGGYWLAVHGANVIDTLGDVKASKLTMDERVAFVESLEPQILAAASDPFAYLWWAEKGMENPWQTLAFCFEWARYVASGKSAEFVSALPVMLDGSCNGAQHFSAMFRDEVGGAAVNLVPSERPADLYSQVAVRLQQIIEERAAAGDEWAIVWNKAGLISRKLVKRPTMTYFYGSKKFGFKTQLVSYLRAEVGKGALGTRTVVGEDGEAKQVDAMGGACAWLAEQLIAALAMEVRCAHDGMLWLHNRATLVAARNQPVEWTVPVTGFFVRQEYVRMKRKQVKTVMHGKRVDPSYYVPTAQIEPRKQKNGVSPNVIHSLDAAALMLMSKFASMNGVTHIAAIHDSFGTHAADTELMRHATRHSFVTLYSQDVAGMLEAQLIAQLGELSKSEQENLVELPAKGDLDLGGVLASMYFFC